MTATLEGAKVIDISEWMTLNTAASSTKIPLGHTPDAKNVWVDEKPGSVITANGYRKVGQVPSGNPPSFCIDYFKSSSGEQVFVVSDNATVWTTVDFQNFTEIITGLSSSFQLRGAVIRDKLWMTNGSDAVRTYDGTTVTVLDGSGSTPNVPRGRYIAYHDERVWMYHVPSNRSLNNFSALTNSAGTIIAPDHADAWPSSNTLQISEGDADFGTGLIVYRGYLYMFKQYSIWRLIGYDEYTYTRVKCRASTGTRFNESLQVVDGYIHMIGVDGIYVFDGESTERISDIIDPSSAAQASFGFNSLQQPNSNNQFWEVSTAANWNAGNAVPSNLDVADQSLKFAAVDTTEADFSYPGTTLTNIDATTTPGSIQLALVGAGGTGPVISTGKTPLIGGTIGSLIGSSSYLTDGNNSNTVGIIGTQDSNIAYFGVDLGANYSIDKIVMNNWQYTRSGWNPLSYQASRIEVSSDGSAWSSVGNLTLPASYLSGSNYQTTITNLELNFSRVSCRYVRWYFSINKPTITMTEFEVYRSGYQLSGKYISKYRHYNGNAPASFGTFNADVTTNGETVTFFTQSSADGVVWEAEMPCTNGGAIGSTLNKYLRWGAYLYSANGLSSPVISAAYLLAKYESAVHYTGGSIFSWGPLEAEYNLAGQTINFYYRGASSAASVLIAAWNLIVPGAVPFKGVTFNWVKGTGVEQQTLQNVASFFWKNRYWMSAASTSSETNDTILIRGKKTFKSPWQLKDWPILSFCRFQDNLYGGSSVDGSIYQLDTGYSKDGSAMDSYFETGDFTFMGNHIFCSEVEIEVERLGSYNLSFGISIDRGNTWTEYDISLEESTFVTSYWVRLFVESGTTPYVRFRVRTNGVDQPFEVHNLRVYYEISNARGSLR